MLLTECVLTGEGGRARKGPGCCRLTDHGCRCCGKAPLEAALTLSQALPDPDSVDL